MYICAVKYFGLIIAFFILGIGLIGYLVMGIFFPHDNSGTITIQVTGIVNATNSSIVSIHFECIKYCIDHVSTEYNNREKCYEQCEKIGSMCKLS